MIKWLKQKLHKHRWQTTHTNRWMHPTRQKCRCGKTRSFEFYPDHYKFKGMPWNKGRWVWSNGIESSYDYWE